MRLTAAVLPEPPLEFRYGQLVADPRDGLSLFGPYSTDRRSHPKNVVFGLIGPGIAMDRIRSWCREFVRPILTDPTQYDTRNWPHFPGFEAAFHCAWPDGPAWAEELDRDALINASKDRDGHQRAAKLVDLYVAAIEKAVKRDEAFSLFVCVVPDEVYKNCRPESSPEDGHGMAISKKERRQRAVSADLFGSYDPDEYRRSPDFRRQLKARAMAHGVPIQIVLESTLNGWVRASPGLGKDSPPSAGAWFMANSMFYKAGGKPWRLSTARDGVCYVGLAFKKTDDPGQSSNTACCAAQMFLDSGDGIVFKGEFGPWYSARTHDFHLSRTAAMELLRGVLQTYGELDGRPLREIFLHSRSWIDAEEFTGYQDACPKEAKLVGIRVQGEREAFEALIHLS